MTGERPTDASESRPADPGPIDPRREAERGASAQDGASPQDGAAAPATQVAPAAVDRRSFVRAIAGESVTTAGKLAGISGMLVGSMVTAAKAANDSFSALGGTGAAVRSPPAAAVTTHSIPATPAPVAAMTLRVSDVDRAVLARVRLGLLATNQPGAAPAVGVVRLLSDGEVIRIPGRSATARTANLQRDPFASLTVIDPETGDALLLAGRVRVLYGVEGREGAEEVLTACGVPLPDGWDAPDTRGEPILVVLEPQRLFRRRAADERP